MVSVPDAVVLQDGETVVEEPMGPKDWSEMAMEAPCRAGDEKADRWRSLGIVWRNVILMALLHIGAVYSILVIPRAKPLTWVWCKSDLPEITCRVEATTHSVLVQLLEITIVVGRCKRMPLNT